MALVESLRAALPASNPALVGRRIALEEVVKVLTDNLFEDVEPAAVLDSRDNEEEGHREFLVRWQDGREVRSVLASTRGGAAAGSAVPLGVVLLVPS